MPLLLMPLLTAYLDPGAYGVLAILTAMGLLLHAVFSVGLGAATAPSYFASAGSAQRGATIWTAFAILSLSSGVMVALATLLAPGIAVVLLGDPQHSRLVILATGATAFSILAIPFRQYLMFEERPLQYVGLSLAALAVSLCLTVWMVIGWDRGLRGVLEADLVGQAVACALMAVPVVRTAAFAIRRRLALDLISLGLPLIPAFASLFVLQHGSRYILQWLKGPEQVGIYAVGVNIAAAVGLFVAGFQSAWLPYFMSYADRQAEGRAAFGRVATYYVLGVGAISLLLYIAARPAVMILAAPEYRAAAHVVGLAATTQFLSGLFLVLLPGVYFAREVRYLGVIQGLAGGVAIALNLLLVPVLGYVGSAISVSMSYLLLCIGQYAWNQYRGHLSATYDWPRLGTFALLYVSVAVLSFWPRALSLAAEAVLSMAGGAALVLIVWALLPVGERSAIRRALRQRSSALLADSPVRTP
jgi:O-antigen/teichoic acid export membrane protein